MDIREILRHLQQGRSDRSIARATGVDRKTIGRYRAWAAEHDLLTRALPPNRDLQRLVDETLKTPPPPQNESSVEPFAELVRKLRGQGVEIAAIHQRLMERGYDGSYASVYRFVRQMEPATPEAVTRVETRPGEEAQVDFGYAGRMIDPSDGALRKTWAFVMTLSWSRHQYVEFVFDQKVETWLSLHRNALAFFGGVPERLVIDNLKAAIVCACWEDPQVQQGYRECAEHYGFLISPCRPRTPEHKGKVEQGGVHYVKRNFLGGREPTVVTQANQDVIRWVNTTAGLRVHGTTREQPLVRFALEKAALRPLPSTAYDLAIWKEVMLHRDCHIVFEQAYYSAPFQLIGQQLRVRGGAREVQIYGMDYQLVATHPRAQYPGQRLTNPDHLPPQKTAGLALSREGCRQQAAEIGAATTEVVNALLEHKPEDRLRAAGRLLRLGERFGKVRLEAACARALRCDDASYMTVKRILEQALDLEAVPAPEPTPPARIFVRPADELVGRLMGGVASWN
jgi:transposase